MNPFLTTNPDSSVLVSELSGVEQKMEPTTEVAVRCNGEKIVYSGVTGLERNYPDQDGSANTSNITIQKRDGTEVFLPAEVIVESIIPEDKEVIEA